MDELLTNIKNALNQFIIDHKSLIIQDVHEEALTSELLHYFKKEFQDLNLDINSNYNKRILGNSVINKEVDFLIEKLPIQYWPRNWENGQTHIKKEILPDFIFHNHASSQSNYLIVELKKSTNKNKPDRDWDFLKLIEMTKRDLNYKWGLFIDLKTGNEFNGVQPYSLIVFSRGINIYNE
ncbi:hypothetical protein [Emticicia sp. 21SJ11W-3]|uniref:hypothetical protein n=1 Tax=Emticicia sp. 21SJ11W-3 TaxID=2916755 RepID=UPI00209EAD1F|nr:hypothetical protein [Emticicia sp. 21SJ11W-3]UTA67562.1 hypothetical protein MB380_18470 [Emticicia sp. 21SJ11W-3]